MSVSQIKPVIYYGPSLYSEVPVLRLAAPCVEVLGVMEDSCSLQQVEVIKSIFPAPLWERFIHLFTDEKPEIFIGAMTIAIQETVCPLYLDFKAGQTEDGKLEVSIQFWTSEPALSALDFSISAIRIIMATEVSLVPALERKLAVVLGVQEGFQPDQTSSYMLKVARDFSIPYYVLFPSTRYIAYGQGVHSQLFTSANNEKDSSIGYALQKNKIQTNRMLKVAGFPATQQHICFSLKAVKEAILKMGFPVVIKPPAEDKGRGIVSNIRDMNDIARAYQSAAGFSGGAGYSRKVSTWR